MHVKGEQPRETHRTLYLLVLEVKGVDYTGGTGTTAMMQSLEGAYSRGSDDETHTYRNI